MKNIFTLFYSIILFTTTISAQVAPPQAFNYSGVARNASNNPIANQTIGIQLSILKGSAVTGTIVYKENHFTNTDALGLFNLAVGSGAVQNGTFSAIDWSNDTYYLRVGLDATGGSNFVTMGSTQLLSVPYALYAKSAGNTGATTDNDTSSTNELQLLSVRKDTIFLTNGGFVKVPASSYDHDTSASNELQTISIRNDTIFLTNGGFAKLPAGTSGGNKPILTTSVSTVTASSASGQGNVTNDGGETILTRGVCYSTTPNPTTSNFKKETTSSNNLGSFNVFLSSLTQGTTYYAKAFATNSNGTAYGNEVSFTTLSPPSTPVTSPATNITSNTAIITSTIATANGNQIIERGICYDIAQNPTVNGNKINGGSGIGSYTISMSGDSGFLNSNIPYYVRAYLKTADGVIYGNQISFTTLSVGQAGQAGGIVFFDKGVYSNGWRYLEKIDDTLSSNTRFEWGCSGTSITGTSDVIGSGKANTTAIVNGCSSSGTAARYCDNLIYGGKNDWFLPSKEELRAYYKNIFLSDGDCWSSTQVDSNNALRVSSGFGFGGAYFYSDDKNDTKNIKIARVF